MGEQCFLKNIGVSSLYSIRHILSQSPDKAVLCYIYAGTSDQSVYNFGGGLVQGGGIPQGIPSRRQIGGIGEELYGGRAGRDNIWDVNK